MKTSPALLLVALLASQAGAAPVTGWVATNGDAGFSGGSETTNSPVTTDSDAETIVGSFPAVTLGIGESLTLSGSVNITGANGTIPGNQFRWGLFDAPGMPATGVGSNYAGVWIAAPAGGAADLVTADGSTTNPFSGDASTAIVEQYRDLFHWSAADLEFLDASESGNDLFDLTFRLSSPHGERYFFRTDLSE